MRRKQMDWDDQLAIMAFIAVLVGIMLFIS